jgi:GntR family transcriptional regulator/MocR family aminotransferase
MSSTSSSPPSTTPPAGEARQLRLYRALKAAILDGRLPPGARLPGSRQLAADRRMARNCVLFAYQLLLAEGFVEADRGGTRVAALPLGRPRGAGARPAAADMLSRRARGLPAISAARACCPSRPACRISTPFRGAAGRASCSRPGAR